MQVNCEKFGSLADIVADHGLLHSYGARSPSKKPEEIQGCDWHARRDSNPQPSDP